jgi:hypothetical protein
VELRIAKIIIETRRMLGHDNLLLESDVDANDYPILLRPGVRYITVPNTAHERFVANPGSRCNNWIPKLTS